MSVINGIISYQQPPAKLVSEQDNDAATQEATVLEFFQSHPNEAFSPEAIHSLLFPQAPITSVRRAISNLTRDDELVRTSESVMGSQGRPVGTWKLKNRFFVIGELEAIVEPVEKTLEELERLETEINAQAYESFYYIGQRLLQIKENGLYELAGFKKWDHYCTSGRVGVQARQIRNFIQAAGLRPNLPEIPKSGKILAGDWNQWQVLELCKCSDSEVAVLVAEKAIEKAVANSQQEGGKFDLTAKLIAQTRHEIEGTPDTDDEPEEQVSLQDALRAATRCKSIDAKYLSKKTGINESKIKASMELSEDWLGYKAKKLTDGTYSITRYRIKTDKQFIAEVKSRRIEGDQDPVDVLSRMLDSIANTIEGVVAQYGPNCKSRTVWNELPTETLENLQFLFKSAQSKAADQFPVFLETIENELLSRRQSGQELS